MNTTTNLDDAIELMAKGGYEPDELTLLPTWLQTR